MAKVDRLGWADGFSFHSFGVPCGIRVNDVSILDALKAELPAYCQLSQDEEVRQLLSLRVGPATKTRGTQNYHLAYLGSNQISRSLELSEVRHKLWRALEHTSVQRSQNYVFVRAGVVSWKGRAILLPGACETGKTTLVAELVKAGCEYYSDEYAVLDSSGQVHPFPRKLAIREGATTRYTPVEDLGGRQGTQATQVACVVSTHYQGGAQWQPRALRGGRIATVLTENAVAVRHRSQDYLDALAHIGNVATGLQGVRGEAGEFSDAILAFLEALPVHSS